jgi:transmembrane sensor
LITEKILLNFFEGKCDAREVALVQAWLRDNPAKLKEYLGVEEWEKFQPAHTLSPDISRKLWAGIDKTTPSPAVHHSYFRQLAVAASIVLVIGLSWQFMLQKQKTRISAAAVATTKHISNTTPQKMTLSLSDGSIVELSPNSTLSYSENFTTAKREVLLTGEATFTIAKDVARPFFVSTNTVLITVLGTRFTVRSEEANKATKVILHDGRVMVKAANSPYYLSPGDIFIFQKTPAPASTANRADPANRINPANPSNPEHNDSVAARILHLQKDKDDCYVFANYPLDVVFDQLQLIYNAKISYNKAEFGNRSFIGKIDKRDSLSHILKSITLLNNFGLHKEGDGFSISLN